MAGGEITDEEIRDMVRTRKCFPVLFGSALKMQGVSELLDLLDAYAVMPGQVSAESGSDKAIDREERGNQPGADREGPDAFSGRVIKITRSASGERETVMKITGGRLAVRQSLRYRPPYPEWLSPDGAGSAGEESLGEVGTGQEYVEEKVTQIRRYSGEKYETVPEALPGMVCAVTGLTATYAGQGFGQEEDRTDSLLF